VASDLWDEGEDDLPPTKPPTNGTDPAEDVIPTPEGRVRAYFNDELMAYNQMDFQVSFQGDDVLAPEFLAFRPPVAMFEDEEPPEAEVQLVMPDRGIEIVEPPASSERERIFRPAGAEPFDFEIRMTMTPYHPEDQEVTDVGE
jgi:hypothetical protein